MPTYSKISPKLLKVAINNQKLISLVLKWLKMAMKGPNQPKMAQHSQQWPTKNGEEKETDDQL